MKKWLLMIRPASLFATLSPVVMGLVLTQLKQGIDYFLAAVTLLSSLCLQIVSNLVNDYFDFRKGNDTVERTGPERPLATGKVNVKEIKTAIGIFMLMAILSGAYLVIEGGVPILLIGISGLLFAWLYTATNYSLSQLGLGDLFVLFYFGPIAGCGTYWLQTHSFDIQPVLLCLGCGFLSVGVLTTNNQRDAEQDGLHHKRTLIVRFGKTFGKILYFISMIAPFVLASVVIGIKTPLLFYLLLALVCCYAFLKCKREQFNLLLAVTGMLNLFYVICVTISVRGGFN